MAYKLYQWVIEPGGAVGHAWGVVDEHGGVHIDIRVSPNGEVNGGLEFHYRKPRGCDDPLPSHEHCWLLGCPCWHEGTSLGAGPYESIFRAYHIDDFPALHERMFEMIACHWVKRVESQTAKGE